MNRAVSAANQAQGNGEAKYFDLHTEGLGYLNRIRVVPVKKGEGYLCCAISALRGATEEPEYTYFDLKVSGAAAKQAVGMLRTAVDNGQRVLIGFKAGDTYPEVFTYESGPKSGQTGVSTRGRLLKVRWAKIDGLPVQLPGVEALSDGEGGAAESVADTATSEATETPESSPSLGRTEQSKSAAVANRVPNSRTRT